MSAPVAARPRPLIADSALDLIGGTPLVRLNRIPPANGATVLGFFLYLFSQFPTP